MTPIETLTQQIGDIPIITMEKAVKAKSRDFFCYSPLLKARLDHVVADAVVAPRNEAEVLQVLTACYALDIPVTERAAGTGNYGQAMPLAPAPDWIEMLVGFDDWKSCLETGYKIARNDGFWLKEVGAFQAPAPYGYFRRHQKFLDETENVVCILVAPNSVDALVDLVSQDAGRIAFRSDQASAEDPKGLPHLHHLLWNHTTLRALGTDPEIT